MDRAHCQLHPVRPAAPRAHDDDGAVLGRPARLARRASGMKTGRRARRRRRPEASLDGTSRVAVRAGRVAVVGADVGAVRLVGVPVLVELRRVLDLVLRAVDEDLPRVEIDVLDHTCRQQDLLAEDPRAGVDDDERRAGVVRRLVHLPDRPVDRLDLEARQVALCPRGLAIRPDVAGRHIENLLSSWCLRPRREAPNPNVARDRLLRTREGASRYDTRSTTMAMPWPPPTHIVSRPIVRSIDSRSFSSVFMIRAPVMPYGWPSAIAPPCGFSLSLNGSTPISRHTGSTCAAKASFNSTTSTSSIVMPARASTRRTASIGPTPMISGSTPETDDATIRARGSIPSSRARVSDMTTTAAAPSFSGHGLPAVTLPPGLNAGSSCDSFSSVDDARGPSSFATPSHGVISRSKKPFSCAATARSCDCWAKRSMSSRETSHRSATFSAVTPIGMYTFAIGASSPKSAGWSSSSDFG